MSGLVISTQARLTLLNFNRYMAKLNEVENNYKFLNEPIACGIYGFNEVNVKEVHEWYENFISYYYLMSEEEQRHMQYSWMVDTMKNKCNCLIEMLEDPNKKYNYGL